jgi:predicted transposase/invertase (TIGR01784 family)
VKQEEGDGLAGFRIHRTNDYLFKRIFSSEEVLLGFLNAVFKPPVGKELVKLTLLDREIDPQHALDRGARLDILARTEEDAIVNIEVQVANEYNIDKRSLYYWSGLYHDQLSEGEKFNDLHKAITINILEFNWFKDDTERYHRTFHIREDNTGEVLNDDLEIHFLEIIKARDLKHKPQDALESWLAFLNNLEGEVMEAIAVENPSIKKALTLEQAFMQNKQERRIYELREKARLDEISALEGSEAKGKVIMAQDAICKFLDARFGNASQGLQKQIREIDKLETLDKIINNIFTANSLNEAEAVINKATK